jgi:hypothetical protein
MLPQILDGLKFWVKVKSSNRLNPAGTRNNTVQWDRRNIAVQTPDGNFIRKKHENMLNELKRMYEIFRVNTPNPPW